MERAISEVMSYMKPKMNGTPFSEYREEQVKVNVFDYFVTPSFFDQFYDTKPLLIYGSRGSGKTTLFKALTLSEAKDAEGYLNENNYIGIYYRIDLNIMASFCGSGLDETQWSKLFSHYFICSINYELIRQIIDIKDIIDFSKEKNFSKKYSLLFSGKSSATSLEELKDIIYNELYLIRDYINNCANQQYPHIGDYATIIKELPYDLLQSVTNYHFSEKIIFYLVDEFEGLKEWQQRDVLSFVKYSDDKHTFKICMRPDGLKSAETIGGEFISETDDIKSIDLNEKILSSKDGYYKYALDVCEKRIKLFYKTCNLDDNKILKFEELFEELTYEQEIEILLKNREKDIRKEISDYLRKIELTNPEIDEYLQKSYFDFLLFKLIGLKKRKRLSPQEIWEIIRNKDKTYQSYVHNYKEALLYYLYFKLSKNKIYSGFKTLVDISGGTLRYLLEICNEIFEIAIANEKFSYTEPKTISYKTQTDAIYEISNKRVKQISAIPKIGPNIRTFIIALGKICQAFHKEERISKIEPNHFSIKSSSGSEDNVSLFLKECVMRGVLIKSKNNKAKNSNYIGADEYIYVLHPIYTPTFQISWRRKQKIEFDINEIKILISNNSSDITSLIKKYIKKTNLKHESIDLEYMQMSFWVNEEE